MRGMMPDADKIYVGYGSAELLLLMRKAISRLVTSLYARTPESFQLDAKTNKLWVNLPGSGMIGVADLKQLKLTAKWSRVIPRSNFRWLMMAAQHRVIVGYRLPQNWLFYNSETRKKYLAPNGL